MITKVDGVTVGQLAELVEFRNSWEARSLIGKEVDRRWRDKPAPGFSWMVPFISFLDIKLCGSKGLEPLLNISMEVAEKKWVKMAQTDHQDKDYGFVQVDIQRNLIDRIFEILGRFPR